MSEFSFKIEKKISGALGRAGVIRTPHGDIETPAFIVVGTKGTVKALTAEQLLETGVQSVLANTYHLFLEPGEEIVKEAGGLNKFMNWEGPTVTDSGGFQVFSLGAAFGKGVSKFAKAEDIVEEGTDTRPNVYNKELAQSHGKLCIVDEDGVTFTSHIDGSMHRFTPERSIEIQHDLGADIIFAFDECTSPTADRAYQKEALDRTHRWAKRSILAHKQNYKALEEQWLFGIVQGGLEQDFREESAKELSKMDFDGYGIGGCFSKDGLDKSLKIVNSILPEEKPRHLLGIGEPIDLFIGIENGIDMFDCVAPTRIARTGSVYTSRGTINLFNAKYRNDFSPIDEKIPSYTSKNYTKAYLAHLFRSKEMLGATLASMHNLYFIVNLVKDIRASILEDRFYEFKDEFLKEYYG
ncbi:tRNA guanosine(34) transglycosylase Tgt [candidate division KSB1 bacterium]